MAAAAAQLRVSMELFRGPDVVLKPNVLASLCDELLLEKLRSPDVALEPNAMALLCDELPFEATADVAPCGSDRASSMEVLTALVEFRSPDVVLEPNVLPPYCGERCFSIIG